MCAVHRMLDELSKYGLTEIQTKVYYHLLKLGRTPSTDIAKALGVHRSEVYRILRELSQMGIATEHSGRPILFTPAPPEKALDILFQERLKNVESLKGSMPKLIEWLDSQAKARKARPSVLLIDDDESITKALSPILEANGFDVDVAGDASQALEKSRVRLYNLALVDIRLPDMQGTKLLKALKDENPEIKGIIITGYPSTEYAVEALDVGADAFLTKPFSPPELLAKMKEKLEERTE
jgi:CheY-like chemotaxis protein/predicted transcriptional regulator